MASSSDVHGQRRPRRVSPLGHLSTCYGCGPDNPASLGLRLRWDNDRAVGEITFDERFEGSPGLVHGGALVTVLDDTIGTVPGMGERFRVTADMSVEFRAPVRIGESVTSSAWVESSETRYAWVQAEICGSDDAEPRVRCRARVVFIDAEGRRKRARNSRSGQTENEVARTKDEEE